MIYNRREPDFHKKWRPAIAWSYLIICMFDFIIAPVFYPIIQAIFINNISQIHAWEPNTLKAGGLYHLSMLAIVGVTAYNRTKEKIVSITAKR